MLGAKLIKKKKKVTKVTLELWDSFLWVFSYAYWDFKHFKAITKEIGNTLFNGFKSNSFEESTTFETCYEITS